MAKQFIELADRVFSWRTEPDLDERPEHCRRTLYVALESGPPLTEEEAGRVTASIVADLVTAGNDVYGWGYLDEG